jgi:hypothetical protein
MTHRSSNIIVQAAVRVIPTPPAPNVEMKTGLIPAYEEIIRIFIRDILQTQ